MPARPFLISLLFSLSITSIAVGEERTRIDYDCHGNALEACYLIVDGDINSAAVARMEEMLAEGVESFQVVLNSKGGDLAAGIAMGRLIREHDLQTRIGVYQEQDFPAPGECLSACAYAFLGGTQRIIREGSRVGFHQFAIGSNAFLEGEGGLIVGQKLSASVIAYMVEMGVDARLFTVASETSFDDMYFPDRPERLEYDVETEIGFDHFFMEPYGGGVIAASKRLGPTHVYDRVDHLTAYCRNGRAHVLLTVSGDNQFVPDPANAASSVAVTDLDRPNWDQWINLEVPTADVRTWTGPDGGYIEIKFDARALPITDATRKFRALLGASRVEGGNYRAIVDLNDMDRNMLRAAFRLCI